MGGFDGPAGKPCALESSWRSTKSLSSRRSSGCPPQPTVGRRRRFPAISKPPSCNFRVSSCWLEKEGVYHACGRSHDCSSSLCAFWLLSRTKCTLTARSTPSSCFPLPSLFPSRQDRNTAVRLAAPANFRRVFVHHLVLAISALKQRSRLRLNHRLLHYLCGHPSRPDKDSHPHLSVSSTFTSFPVRCRVLNPTHCQGFKHRL